MVVRFDDESIKETQSMMNQHREENQEPATEQEQELSIDQEYDLWKKNCQYMYDFVYETNLRWPSLSVQWFPQVEYDEETQTLTSDLLLGTNTSSESVENVKIASATGLPAYISSKYYNSPKTKNITKFKISKKFDHMRTEVNRARFMPQNPDIIASISGGGDAYLYSKSGNINGKSNRLPIATLKSHVENGFGLDWNPLKEGMLITGSDDKTVALWDVNSVLKQANQQNGDVEPLNVLSFHKDIVNDVKWNKFDENLFGSVSDDKSLIIYDMRDLSKPAMIRDNIHAASINSLAFSPFSKNLLATGCADSTIGLFDLRNLDKRLHSMMGHSAAITSLEWAPHIDGFLASGSEDRRVIIWDISKIGEEQNQDDAEDGAPEVFMMHAGHTSLVSDISWHPDQDLKWVIASVSDNNVIQVWKSNKNLTNPIDGWENDDIDLNDLE